MKAQKNGRSWRENKETELETEEEDFVETEIDRDKDRNGSFIDHVQWLSLLFPQHWALSLGMNFPVYVSWKQGSTVTTFCMILIKNSHRETIL